MCARIVLKDCVEGQCVQGLCWRTVCARIARGGIIMYVERTMCARLWTGIVNE